MTILVHKVLESGLGIWDQIGGGKSDHRKSKILGTGNDLALQRILVFGGKFNRRLCLPDHEK